MEKYYKLSKDDLKNLPLLELEELLKTVRTNVNNIDNILYTDRLNKETFGMNHYEKERYIENMLKDRDKTVKFRNKVDSAYRTKKLEGTSISKKALNFGVYNDIHTPNFKPSAKGHFAAIRGICL